MKISKWMKGFLSFLLSFTVMFTTMIQQNAVLADEGSIDPAEVIDEEMAASSPEAEATPAASEPVATPVALETAEPTVQPDETPAVQEADVQTESTPAEAPQAATAQPAETQEEAYVSPTSFDAETDNIKVHAETAEGAFNEPVTLVVNVLEEDTEDYKKVQETMDQNGSSQDGMLALDIRFENSSNQEVEPNGQVSISVVIKDAASEDAEEADDSSLQVIHLKEETDGSIIPEKVADNDENTEGYIRTSGNDIQADFVAASFSTFVISRAQSSNSKIYFTDANGTQIAEAVHLTIDLSGTDLTQLKSIPEYQNPVVRVGSYTGAQIASAVLYWKENKSWIYTLAQRRQSQYLNGNDIYVVYEKTPQAAKLTPVNTVDSTSKGFHIYLVDMGERWKNSIGGYKDASGMLSQGIYGRTLYNGYPYFVDDAPYLRGEFADKFADKKEVNHLFYEDEYVTSGYFYYNSAKTFASLQGDNTFLVSQELGSPSKGSDFFYQRGNFFPYNSLNLNKVNNYNLYDDKGGALKPSDDRYNENLYGMNEETNFGFGMHAYAEFYQPVNGQVNGGKDMVYEFTGDDDMLVYIDDVLVLDLGGVHDAQSGDINFHTGIVTFHNINKGDKIDYGSSTTIYDQYESAGRLGTTTWSEKTFAAGSSHRIDIFYMERGKGASNLKMRVNIPPVPDGTVAVSKQVEG
ncbi:MAG: hypothetical protein PUF68_07930, partial [Lactimicrobium massiliense]|nr:hypothetical protein [Lactimicrobium massiliense]